MSTLPTDGYDRDDVRVFLTEYGAALGAGDLEGIGDRFAFPALLVLPDASLPLPDPEAVHDSVRDRLSRYREQDLVAAVPQVLDVDQAGPSFLWADVRWSYQDENAAMGATERFRYLLRRGRDTFEICVIVPTPD
jgi:hypothetical protein